MSGQKRWRVRFRDMAYDGGVTATWTEYHRTRLGAHLSAWWHQHVGSWGGLVTIKDMCKTGDPS